MVTQVPIIGILMIVNGVLCVLYGTLLMFMGPFVQTMMNMQAAQAPPQAQQQMQQQMDQVMQVMTIVYMVMGAAVFLAGAINIGGGVSAMRFRSRAFVITALFFNVAALPTCYCLPTSLGLMIWGLIVLFQKDVTEAFVLGASGLSADEIKMRMTYGEDRRDDDDFDDDRDEHRSPKRPPPKIAGDEGIKEI